MRRQETLPLKGVQSRKTRTLQSTRRGWSIRRRTGGRDERRDDPGNASPTQTHPPTLPLFRVYPRTSKKEETQCRRLSNTFFQRIARSWVLMRTMAADDGALARAALAALSLAPGSRQARWRCAAKTLF